MAVNDVIPSKLLDTPTDIEGVTVKINHTNPVVISVIYAAPQSSVNYFNSCCDHLSNLISTGLPIIVVGDFNLPDINWTTLSGSSTISNQFCECIFELNLNQLIEHPTHIHGNILDLVLTDVESLIHCLSVDNSKSLPIRSDHYPITFEISASLESGAKQVGPKYTYNFSNGDYIGMCSYLFETDFSCLTSLDVETTWL